VNGDLCVRHRASRFGFAQSGRSVAQVDNRATIQDLAAASAAVARS
jgi:hypothetical protein